MFWSAESTRFEVQGNSVSMLTYKGTAALSRLRLLLPYLIILLRFFQVCSLASYIVRGNEAVLKDYCLTDIFNATCNKNEAVYIVMARYGRMKVGRCLQGNYDMNCAVDARRFLDRKCSGRQSCEYRVPGPELFKTKPCPDDLTSYLEASYICIEVAVGDQSNCLHDGQNIVSLPQGYISSVIAEEYGFGDSNCPWTITGQPGQMINFTLYNFMVSGSSKYYGNSKLDVCFEVVVISEQSERKTVAICGSDQRERHIVLTKVHTAQVEVINRHLLRTLGAFILAYNIVGCPSAVPLGDAWSRRDGDTLVVGCNSSSETWYMTCQHNRWIGDLINCSSVTGSSWKLTRIAGYEEPFPYGILVVVTIGVAIGVIIGGLLLCLITMLTKRSVLQNLCYKFRSNQQRVDSGQKEYQAIVCQMPYVTHGGSLDQTTILSDWMRSEQFSDMPVFCDVKGCQEASRSNSRHGSCQERKQCDTELAYVRNDSADVSRSACSGCIMTSTLPRANDSHKNRLYDTAVVH